MTDEELREPERPVRSAAFRPTGPEEKARCEDFAERISHFHDGRWPEGASECLEVEEHLAQCPRCAEILEDYRAITAGSEIIRSAEISGVDGERTSRRVRARLRRRVFRRRLRWAGAGVGLAAAAAAVVLSVALAPPAPPPDELGVKPGVTGLRDAPSTEELLRILGARRDRAAPRAGVVPVGDGTAPAPERARRIPRQALVPGPPLLGLYLADAAGSRRGLRIVEVIPRSPAERAGLLQGDYMLKIGDENVSEPDGVRALVRRAGPGAKIRITYARGGEIRTVEVVLAGER